MNRLEIQETARTPHIVMDAATNTFLIEGKFFPENIKDFLVPIINWLNEFKTKASGDIELHCNLDYLSSSSIIYLKQILQKFEELQSNSIKVTVVWFHDDDDDDIRKTAEYYMKNTKLNFILKTN